VQILYGINVISCIVVNFTTESSVINKWVLHARQELHNIELVIKN